MKKNVLLVISFCLTMLLLCNTVSAQVPTGVFAKATTAPQVDGVVDDLWANATVYNIDKPLKTETPTLGTSGQTTWQALWTNDGIYILLNVTDDVFFPNWAVTPAASDNWNYDKPEIYFDVNTVLNDTYGPGTTSPNNKGHYQVAPGFPKGYVDGTKIIQSDGISYAFKVTDNNYVAEYFVPFSKLLDKDGKQVKKTATIGFDVQLIDRDVTAVTKSRQVWANNLAVAGESYTNMDACGTVTLQGGDSFVDVIGVTLNSGGTITTNNGTLQMVPTFDPANASNQAIKWSVTNGTGMACISPTGLLTALKDGTVTVKAESTDEKKLSATTDVVISGQGTTIDKIDVWSSLNLIKNWNFDTDMTSWSNWVDGNSQLAPVVEDGVCVMRVNKATDGAAWHYQFNQSGMTADANVAYTLKFKSWANVDNTPCSVDFEDIAANGNKRYGTSTDAEAVNGASEWKYTVNTTPQWFTYHVVFDKMVASTVQKLQWMNSLSLAKISLDSVLLIKDADLPIFVNSISLNTEGTITTKDGTLQMVATVLPETATNKEVKWSVTPEGIATINATGLLTAVANGTVTVKAEAIDGSLKSTKADVIVTGQKKDLYKDFNLIKNWNFNTDLTDWGAGWVDDKLAGQVAPVVLDGVAVMKPSKSADSWHYQFSQKPLSAEANVAYTLKFKSWATADNTPCAVDFEDLDVNNYNRYGTTTDPESADGKSEWHYNVNVTPTWFTFHVTFDKMIPATVQKIQWMLSLSNETISLDSVMLIKDSELPAIVSPVANAGEDQSVNEGATVTLNGLTSTDPNGNALTYRWIAPAGVVLSSTTVAKPTFTAPEVTGDKTYTLSLVVGYKTIASVADQVVVTVKQVDKAPYVKLPIEDVSVDKGAAVKTIDLSTVFADDDLGDVLAYTVTNSNEDVVSAFITAGKLTLTFSTTKVGTSEVVVTATSNGKEVKETVKVDVKTPTGIDAVADQSFVQLYPNPTKGKVELKLSEVSKAGTMITVYNHVGQVILKTVTGSMNVNLDLSGNPAGMYFIKVGQKTVKLVVE